MPIVYTYILRSYILWFALLLMWISSAIFNWTKDFLMINELNPLDAKRVCSPVLYTHTHFPCACTYIPIMHASTYIPIRTSNVPAISGTLHTNIYVRCARIRTTPHTTKIRRESKENRSFLSPGTNVAHYCQPTQTHIHTCIYCSIHNHATVHTYMYV